MHFALRVALLLAFTTVALAQPGLAALCAVDDLQLAATSIEADAPADEGEADCCPAGLCGACCVSVQSVIASEPGRSLSYRSPYLRPASAPAPHGAPPGDLLRPPIVA